MYKFEQLEDLLQFNFETITRMEKIQIMDFLSQNHFLPTMLDLKNRGVAHSVGVAKKCAHLSRLYFEYIHEEKAMRTTDLAVLGGFLHDAGKLLTSESLRYSKHDTLNLEILLRKYGLVEFASVIRTNPYLFLFDFRNGNLTIPQLIVNYADTFINSEGEEVDRENRLKDVIARKRINKEFQSYYWNLLEQIFNSKTIQSLDCVMKIGFIERCDGRYHIENNRAYLDSISSYHIAKGLAQMGYISTIYGYFSEGCFDIDEISFKSVGNYLPYAYNLSRKNDFIYITGWTKAFKEFKKNNNLLPMLVMRSLKEDSLKKDRLRLLGVNKSRVILVSQASKKLLEEKIARDSIEQEGYRVIPNGINKEIFRYRQRHIKKQFVYCGAIVEEKGILEIIDLASSLPDYECLLIGESKMYGPGYNISRVNLPSNVKLLGQKEHSSISQIYNESAFSVAFTLKDKLFETFGKSVVESQACGCPVLYFENGGLIENVLQKSPNQGFLNYDRDRILNYIRQHESKFFDKGIRADLSDTTKQNFDEWKEVSCKYISVAYEELFQTLRDKLINRQAVNKYIYSS